MSRQEGTEYSRRGVLATLGVVGGISTGTLWGFDQLNDFEVDDVELDSNGYVVEAGATESDGIAAISFIPENGPLTLSCWIDPGAVDEYQNGFVDAVGPDGTTVNRRLLSNPSPSELLRSERFYRVETAQTAGDHALRLADGDNNTVETATISIKRRHA